MNLFVLIIALGGAAQAQAETWENLQKKAIEARGDLYSQLKAGLKSGRTPSVSQAVRETVAPTDSALQAEVSRVADRARSELFQMASPRKLAPGETEDPPVDGNQFQWNDLQAIEEGQKPSVAQAKPRDGSSSAAKAGGAAVPAREEGRWASEPAPEISNPTVDPSGFPTYLEFPGKKRSK